MVLVSMKPVARRSFMAIKESTVLNGRGIENRQQLIFIGFPHKFGDVPP